ncbi:uncharacterized protein H6S33_006469 [Morchella sextelata]|uniref:uncharacterized protein n=1 Tax=Morchella sextelata TaxID=1174677 RepID=UPI001D057F49|nr:uncharacterized protein H6S33_006469 [Morchella sextelata]KAH0604801.1 hypothetical protein H6S33_006469 [Morchella sextelata]
MMALTVPNPPTTPRRVKVYELRNNDWFDRGTGYCTGQLVNDEPHIQVKSEEEQDRMLLETKIIKDDGYQKQQETLIVWTEPHGTDMALSFQEPEGCAAIWEFVSHVQTHLLSMSGTDEMLSDDPNEAMIASVMLPPPELGNLMDIENQIRIASSTVPGRDSLGKFILSEDYIGKLIPLLEVAEDLESLDNLHRLCNIMKMMILLNDTLIIEHIVMDEVVLGVVGILEYDPDFPSHKANHRQFLSDKSKFKEVVPIKDPEIKKKIHWTYRLQYLKDVVLARILDDPTFSVLNSLIFFNQVDILQHLQSNQAFLKDLFAIFHTEGSEPSKKKNGVLFIQQCCSIAKNLQGPARTQLYTYFIQNGLFAVIDFALLHEDAAVRIAGTEVLVAMIDHDPVMMRNVIFRQISDKQKPLTDTLIELLLGEQDLGVKGQIADAIRVLLDPATGPQLEGLGKSSDITMRLRSHSTDHETESFLKNFYDESAKKLFLPLSDLSKRTSLKGLSIAEVSLYSHLVETLCIFVRQHAFRGKYFLLAENLPSRVAQLLESPQKHLKLTALKFFRENVKQIILHLVENYREKMSMITYVDTFSVLILRNDQMQDSTLPSNYPSEVDRTPRNQINGARRWDGIKETDPLEEEYFNGSDEEDNTPGLRLINGGTPVMKGLVDYADEESMDDIGEEATVKKEDEGEVKVEIKMEDSPVKDPSSSATPSPSTSPSTVRSKSEEPVSSLPMPERLAEKRRREEEDDDELGKLSRTKKRGPSGGSSLIQMGSRKRSFGGSGSPPSKKIAINLAVKTTTAGDAADENSEEPIKVEVNEEEVPKEEA